LLLREAASFDSFDGLKLNLDLVKFFTRSDALFKFLEELAREKVEIKELSRADAYMQFDEHLEILEILQTRYKAILQKNGFSDKAILPYIYELNSGFIASFDEIEIHIEGLLSRFEFELIDKIASIAKTIIYFQSSKFTSKMQARFGEYGIDIPIDSSVVIDFSAKKILLAEPIVSNIDTRVLSVSNRFEQIAVAFEEIEEMVQSGIEPENIVLILPNEKFKDSVEIYDGLNNLNFAMGDSYTKGKNYKILNAIEQYSKEKNAQARIRLSKFGVDISYIDELLEFDSVSSQRFFEIISELKLLDCPIDSSEIKIHHNPKIYELHQHMNQIFVDKILRFIDWLTMWINAVSTINSDDIRGGKITVMGALETRGATFDGVVVLDFNDGITPALPSKDMFLNSNVRQLASLPTTKDREDLQKQLYKRVLEQAKKSTIIYTISDNKLPSKFLYELGLNRHITKHGDMRLMYAKPSSTFCDDDPIVKDFDATKIIWSSSKLYTYLLCKRKYYYSYIKKIKAKENDEPNDGTLLHKLFEDIFSRKSFYDNEYELIKDVSIELENIIPSNKAEDKYKKLLWHKKLQKFARNQIKHFDKSWRVVECELEVNGEICGVRFTGKIDRIDQTNTHTIVLDYKSGAIKNKQSDKETNFQMSIYYAMLSPKYKNISFGFLPFFDKDKIVAGRIAEVESLEEKNEYLYAHIERLKTTKEFEATKCEDTNSCAYCPYTMLCERGEYL